MRLRTLQGWISGSRISIHAPRAGCDCSPTLETAPSSYFNPRTPCGVRRGGVQERGRAGDDFNPRTPCGVRPCPPTSPVGPNCISIHAPRAGCDRLPCMPPQSAAGISIHAPRAGCDPGERSHSGPHLYFNPRTPCGVRPCGLRGLTTRLLFQSTHPVRGATFETVYDFAYTEFQSTHPVRGATAYGESIRPNDIIFQSTHPVRGATYQCVRASDATLFQSTHPVRGATRWRKLLVRDQHDFNPRTPCGVRLRRVD